MNLFEQLEILLVGQDFVLYSSSQAPRQLELAADHTVRDGVVGSWSLLEKGRPIILLQKKNGDFYARLNWDGKTWSGTDGVGHAELRPSNSAPFITLFHVDRDVEIRTISANLPVTQRISLDFDIRDQVQIPKQTGDTAVAVIGCDRFDYFKRTLESLVGQIEQYPIWIFLDKTTEDSRIDQMDQQAQLAKRLFPDCSVVKRSENFGCGLNLIDVRDQLLNRQEYQRLFVFEDDMVVSPSYVKFCEALWGWSRWYSNVGAVQGWSRCLLPKTQKNARSNDVFHTTENLWGYLIGRECWQASRPYMLEYARFLTDRMYDRRDNFQITKWMSRFRQMKFTPRGETPFPLDTYSSDAEQTFLENTPTGQDGVTQVLMRHTGYSRLAPVVNRSLYIGKTGIHSNPDLYRRQGFDQMEMTDFKGDPERRSFKPRGKNEQTKALQGAGAGRPGGGELGGDEPTED